MGSYCDKHGIDWTLSGCMLCNPHAEINMNVTEKLKNPPTPKRKKDYIAILLDESGSIADARLTDTAFNLLLEQHGNLKTLAADPDRDVSVRYYKFGFYVSNFASSLSAGIPIPVRSEYRPAGGTNLYGAICKAIADFQPYDVAGEDTSFLIVAITDGKHNQSYVNASGKSYSSYDDGGVRLDIEQKQAKGNWSFVALVPNGKEHYATEIGIPSGNVQGFESTTQDGFREASTALRGQTVAYTTTMRAAGARSTSSYFTNVDSNAVKSDLNDATDEFQAYAVPRELRIDVLVTYQRGTFEKGRTFYQLTKPEKLATDRRIVLRDKTTKRLYSGHYSHVRKALGLPVTGDIRIKPGDHGKYDIFVLSKSDNRLLVRGTDILYTK